MKRQKDIRARSRMNHPIQRQIPACIYSRDRGWPAMPNQLGGILLKETVVIGDYILRQHLSGDKENLQLETSIPAKASWV